MSINLSQIVAPSVKELFVNQLETLIITGKLQIGERLPTEREIAQQMNISKTIVNLGLGELHRKGFVDIVPRQGTFVADYIKRGTLETMITIINNQGGTFDKHIFDSLMEFRINNEVASVKLAAKFATPKEVEQLKLQVEAIKRCNSPESISSAIYEFHHIIMCATHNCIYPLMYNAFKDICIKMVILLFKKSDHRSTLTIIEQLTVAIENKQEELASQLMFKLLTEGINELDTHYVFA